MNRIGRLRRRNDLPGDRWWRDRLLVRARLRVEEDGDGRLDPQDLDRLTADIDTLCTIELLPTVSGLVGQFVPFEHFLIVQNGSFPNNQVREELEHFFANIDDLVDRRLKLRALSLRSEMPSPPENSECHVYFGMGLFLPKTHREVPRGRVYARIENNDDPEDIRDYDIVFGGQTPDLPAGWYLGQDRLCFSGWAEGPAMPHEPAGRTGRLRANLGDDSIYFVSCLPQEPRPIVMRRSRSRTDRTDHFPDSVRRPYGTGLRRLFGRLPRNRRSGRTQSLVAPSDHDPSPSYFTCRSMEGASDLVYEAELHLPTDRASGLLSDRVMICVEPNVSISRLRSAPGNAGPVYVEILGVLVPRALKSNNVVTVNVHSDADNLLRAHSFRAHAQTLVLHRTTAASNSILDMVRDNDAVLRCTEHETAPLPLNLGANGAQRGQDVVLSRVQSVAADLRICNSLPRSLGLADNSALPATGCHLVHRGQMKPLGYMVFPVHPRHPRNPAWKAPLGLRLSRDDERGVPDRDFLIDWLDEAIQIEMELDRHGSDRVGYASWLADDAAALNYGVLAARVEFAVEDGRTVLREWPTGELRTHPIARDDTFRAGPLILRLSYR